MQLAFNRETGAVGIRAAAPGTPGSYRLRHQMKGAGRQITGRRFFLHFGLDLTAPARSFDVTDFGGGLIGFTFEVKPAAPVEESRCGSGDKTRRRPSRPLEPQSRLTGASNAR